MVMLSPGALQGDPRLGHALRRVRRRHALRLLLRGLAIAAACVVLGIALAALGLDGARYAAGWLLAVRALLYAWIAFAVFAFVVRPLVRNRRAASDVAVARYVEEHEPALDAALRSAVDRPGIADGAEARSPGLHHRLVDDVVERLES